MRWEKHIARTGEMKYAYKTSVGKSERKGTLGRHRCRWKDYIKIDLREVGGGEGIVDWIHVNENRSHWLGLGNAVI
jgi:hypothetical protein